MISRLVFLLFCGNIALNLGNAQKLPRVKKQSLKVHINATSDAVCMTYIRPGPSAKLEGFILGYGSSFYSNQYVSLPSDGKSYITEVDAEPRYLISVRLAPVPNHKKPCSGKTKTTKPLQLVVGTLTPTSVFLSWGILVNPKHDWTTMNNCANGRFYTVRFREKDKNKKWVLQLCPTTETVVDNLKPNTIYEFGVKDNTENGIWSKIFHHKIEPNKNKENGQLQNTYKLPKTQTLFIPGNEKALIPITTIKQVIQNITHRTKSTEKSPLAGPILDFNETLQKLQPPLALDTPQGPKKISAMNITHKWPAESKTSEVHEISPHPPPVSTELDWESNKPTAFSVSEESVKLRAHTDSELESSKPSIASMTALTLDKLAGDRFPEFPKTKAPPTFKMPKETLASSETQPVPLQSQTSAPKSAETKLAFSESQPVLSSPRTPDEIDISDSKSAATNEPTLESLTPKTAKPLEWPKATLAPSEIPLVPSKWKPSATPEGWRVKLAPKPSPLEQYTPKTSKITELLKTTPAQPETKFVPTPKSSVQSKIPETRKPAEKEPQWETTASKFYKIPHLARTTLAPSKTKITVSKPQILPYLEKPKIVPAVTSKFIPVPVTTMIFHSVGHPVATTVSYEPTSKSKESDRTMKQVPDNQLASTETDNLSSMSSTTPELPITESAPKIKLEPTISPHVLHVKPVQKPTALRTVPPKREKEERDHVPSKAKTDVPQTKPDMEAVTFRTEQPKSTIAPKQTRRVPPRIKTSPSPGITKPGPKGSRQVPSRPKTSPSPNIPQTKPVPPPAYQGPINIHIHVFNDSKDIWEVIPFSQDPLPAMTPGYSERAKATLASRVEYFIPNKSKTSTMPRMLETKPAGHQATSQPPLIIKSTIPSELPKATTAPKETWFIPSKSQTSVKPEVPQTKPVPAETPPEPINVPIHVFNGSKDIWVSPQPQSDGTTESPHLKTAHKAYLTSAKPKTTDKSHARIAIHKTTPVPGRTRTSEMLGSEMSRGDKLIDQGFTKYLTTSSSTRYNKSMDSTTASKKTSSVATPPDPPRPPLAPVKPTPVRRKPLPPNTVTGKPGSSGNIFVPKASSITKPTRSTALVKTVSPKKPPAASSSPDYSNTALFSSYPTSQTDSAGKPRYTGDHVKYMRKNDTVPCSITGTLDHFPKRDEDTQDIVTSPPQNPPSNLTVVAVEGCPSFVILDWDHPVNDTVKEFKVVSTENGSPNGKDKSIITTNQTHSAVENLKPNTSYEFVVIPTNPLGEGPSSESKQFKTESADPRVNEQIPMGKDAIWTEIKFDSDSYSECKGKQFVKRTWYKKFVGVQLCNSLRYKIYLSDSLTGKFYDIGDQRGYGEDHCQFVDSYLDGKTGQHLQPDRLPTKNGFFRAFRQEPVKFGKIGSGTHTNYVQWYECGTTIPGKW